MPSLRNEKDRQELVERLHTVMVGTKPQWGSLDAPRMMCHLNDSLGAGLGKLEVPRKGPAAFRHFPLKHLAIYVVPMPKNAKAPKELLARSPADFAEERRQLLQGMEQMAAMPKSAGPEHFLLGAMSYDQWNILNWKHIDHHLRQFGA
jgi:hypothetical protein